MFVLYVYASDGCFSKAANCYKNANLAPKATGVTMTSSNGGHVPQQGGWITTIKKREKLLNRSLPLVTIVQRRDFFLRWGGGLAIPDRGAAA